MDVTLVPSTLNLADRLTRILQRWFDVMKRGNGPEPLMCTTHVDELNAYQILTIYWNSGHSGVWRTTYFVMKVCLPTTKAAVRSAIRMPVDRPSTNLLAKRKAGSKQKLAETRDGHHAIWCLSFFDANKLWPVTFLNLEAVDKAGLGDRDLPPGGSVL